MSFETCSLCGRPKRSTASKFGRRGRGLGQSTTEYCYCGPLPVMPARRDARALSSPPPLSKCVLCGIPLVGIRGRGLGSSTSGPVNRCNVCGSVLNQKISLSFVRKKSPKLSKPNVVEQLSLLVQLYQGGALTEQEFLTLKSRLVDGGNS